jgi:hypothetical protein
MRRKISLPAFLYSIGLEPQLEELRLKGLERQAAVRARTHDVASALRRGECVPQGVSAVERGVEILDWAAVAYPGQIVGYPDFAKAALRLDRRPQAGSIDIQRARMLVQNAARRLCKDGRKVKRWVVTEPGVGARATVDNADAKANYMPNLRKRAAAPIRKIIEHLESIRVVELSSPYLDIFENRVRELKANILEREGIGVIIPDWRPRIDAVQERITEARLKRSK